MRGLALNVAVAVLLAGLGQAKAELAQLILYEGFSYGDEAGPLAGLDGGEGWGGPWGVVRRPETANPENNWARYIPGGLTFGKLLVDVSPKGLTGGKARIRAGDDYVHVKGVRQLGLKPPDAPPPQTIWGSYLWARRSYSSAPNWVESMSALLVTNQRETDDKGAEFYSAGDMWNSDKGGVGIRDSGGTLSRANEGEPITDFDAYLVIFKVTGLGTNNPSITEWILNLDQFRHFKPYPDGWLTEEELTVAGVGPADDQVWQKQPQPSPLTSSVLIEYPLNDFVGLMSYDGGITPIGMEADFDELRIANGDGDVGLNGDGDVGLNKVTPIPEPSTFLLTLTLLLGLAAYARRKPRL